MVPGTTRPSRISPPKMPLLSHPSARSWGALAPFQIRSYRYQWPADLVTSWAFEMETLILGWYMLVETNSVVMLTIFGALFFVGSLFVLLFGVLCVCVGFCVLLFCL